MSSTEDLGIRMETCALDVLALQPRRTVRYVCGVDGFATSWHFIRHSELAGWEMRAHIEAAHPEHVPHGRCAECGHHTDYFKADSALGVAWLCEKCAPAMPPIEDGVVVP